MLLESSLLKQTLYKKKRELMFLLDKARISKVRFRIEDRLSIIDYLFMWVSEIEKGETNMAELRLGELTKWEPKPKANGIDEKIINDSKNLKKNFDAIKVTVETVKWSTFYNRTYALRDEKKIDEHIVPRKDENGIPHLVYLEEASERRRNKD